MKVTDLIQQRKGPLFSVEITPPLKTKSIDQVFAIIDRILPYNPSFINVTYHQEAIGIKEIDGWSKQVTFQKHASIVGICSAIRFKYGLDVVPHFLCGGFDRFETQDALFDLCFLGIENVLALRGDPRKNEKYFVPKLFGHTHASSLVEQIRAMQRDQFIHALQPEQPIRFCIGVAGYPEKHHEADSMEEDIRWLKHKIDCGADYIVTQLFFDIERYDQWLRACRNAGINVPVIPGIKPFTKKRHLTRLPEKFDIAIPDALRDKIQACTSKEKVWQTGIDFTVDLCRKLIQNGAPGIHLFSMETGEDVAEVARKVFTNQEMN